MGALDLAAEVIVQPRKVDVEVVKLRLVVDEDANGVGRHAYTSRTVAVPTARMRRSSGRCCSCR